jgi:polyribonucleotide nucleotidyltransferase
MSSQKFVTESAKIQGREIIFEVGRFAGQATAAVVGRMGDCMILVTVVGGKVRDDIDWFPLQVEFQEKLYAGGKIKGSRWVKREGRPSDEAILTGRVIDRSIRPLFSDGYKGEVQVVINPLSTDQENDIDVLALSTVSAALAISGLPWEGPLAGIRISTDEKGEFIAYPTYEQRENSNLDLVVSASKDAVVMVEGGAKEIDEDTTVRALEFGKEQSQQIIQAIERLVKKVGKDQIEFEKPEPVDAKIMAEIKKQAKPVIDKLLASEDSGKINKESLFELVDPIMEKFKDSELKRNALKNELEKMFKQAARDKIIDTQTRLDGRKVDEIRALETAVGMIPRTHGSGMFKRGETQALSLTTLASPSLSQTIELMDREIEKRYIHHYNMPPYSVGETGRVGFSSRREIGHGALAERALMPVLPSEEEFPYTIRVVSECVSSNGSTSMASTCGSSLSLMHAGVPIKAPVAGIAMGLMVKDEDKGIVEGEYVILTDIQGLEDHIGDMDFKVTGTSKGITALQMDIKVKGITIKVLSQALAQAKTARLTILDKMTEAIAKPADKVSQYAPKIKTLQIAKDQIGEVIGPGGRIIRAIIEATGAEVDINDEGRVVVTSKDEEGLQKALDWIDGLTREIKAGEEFENAKVTRMMNFGAFAEILPGREGLIHVSKMAVGFVSNPNDVVKEGQTVKVRVEEIDDMGRVNLSMLFGEDIEKAKQSSGGRGGDRNGGSRPGGFSRGGGYSRDNNNRRFGDRDQRRNDRNGGRDQNRSDRSGGRNDRRGFSPRNDDFKKTSKPARQVGTPKTMADWNDK